MRWLAKQGPFDSRLTFCWSMALCFLLPQDTFPPSAAQVHLIFKQHEHWASKWQLRLSKTSIPYALSCAERTLEPIDFYCRKIVGYHHQQNHWTLTSWSIKLIGIDWRLIDIHYFLFLKDRTPFLLLCSSGLLHCRWNSCTFYSTAFLTAIVMYYSLLCGHFQSTVQS